MPFRNAFTAAVFAPFSMLPFRYADAFFSHYFIALFIFSSPLAFLSPPPDISP